MTTPDIMPVIHVQGSWGDMGQQVGQMFAPLIDRHVEAWLGHVRAETGCSREAALSTAMTSRRRSRATRRSSGRRSTASRAAPACRSSG